MASQYVEARYANYHDRARGLPPTHHVPKTLGGIGVGVEGEADVYLRDECPCVQCGNSVEGIES